MALLNKISEKAIHADFAKHDKGFMVKDQESDIYRESNSNHISANSMRIESLFLLLSAL